MALDPNSPIPVYQQIAAHVRRAVAAGVHRCGELVPSVRALALELVVNPNTVQRAYEELEREGVIEPRRGLGMAVTSNGRTAARAKSEAAVYSAFVQGIRAGHAARIDGPRIRTVFERAWEAQRSDQRSES